MKNISRILYTSLVELDIPNACQTHTTGVLEGFSKNRIRVDAILLRPKIFSLDIQLLRMYYIYPWNFSKIGRLWIKVLEFLYYLILCSIHKYDAIYTREHERNPVPAWFSKFYKIPLYIEVNSILPQDIAQKGGDRKRVRKAIFSQARTFNQAEGIIVPSYPRCEWIKQEFNIESSKIHLVINGTNNFKQLGASKGDVFRKYNLPIGGFFVGYIGNIWNYYDLYTTIKAVKLIKKEIPTIHLVFIGDGPERQKLQENIIKLGLEKKVTFTGFIKHESLSDFYSIIDVGLMNMTEEGVVFGGPVTSRFATYSLLNILTISNNDYLEYYPREIRENLLKIKAGNVRMLADTLRKVYYNPGERIRKAALLKRYVERELSWRVVTMRIIKIIEQKKGKNFNCKPYIS